MVHCNLTIYTYFMLRRKDIDGARLIVSSNKSDINDGCDTLQISTIKLGGDKSRSYNQIGLFSQQQGKSRVGVSAAWNCSAMSLTDQYR